jgi:tetratricopeptide (TPR) repeat protein
MIVSSQTSDRLRCCTIVISQLGAIDKMKLIRHSRWVAIGITLFLSLSSLLDFVPAKVLSQSPSAIEKPIEIAQKKPAKDCSAILAQGDELYLAQKQQEAEALYRKCKPDFSQPTKVRQEVPEPVTEIKQLGGGERLWQNALDGIAKNIDSKTYFSLVGLTKTYPQFIPAYLKLAEFCNSKGKYCEQYGKEGQPKDAIQVLDRVTELYPDNPELMKTKVKLLADGQEYLEASIAARQFALIYNDAPEADEFTQLADDYLKKFEKETKDELVTQGVLSGLIGLGQTIAGDWKQGISGFQTIALLLRGESNFGAEVATLQADKYKEDNKLLTDQEIVNYIKGIAGRFTPLMGRNFEYEYYVVRDSDLNAFALPGGKVFVNTGAILNTNSEAELAGVLAHEISHSVLSHGFRRVAQSNVLSSLGNVVPFVNLFSELVTKQYSRDNERQADILGTKVLANSGYAADGLRNFMATLNQKSGDVPRTLTSTHPAPIERVRYLEDLIQKNSYNRYAYEGVKKHQEIQKRIQNTSNA